MEVKPKIPGPVYALSWINTVTTIFEYLDKDANGITPDEIKAKFPKEEVAADLSQWLAAFDIDKDKRITLAEFWRTFIDKEKEHNFPNSYTVKAEA